MTWKKRRDHNKKAQTFAITLPTAQSVQLAADFTGWREHPLDLHKETGGVWRTTVALEPGEHRYRFLVDGQWCDDPAARQTVPNPFGGVDAVLNV